ncbi:hypothetical protein HAX54_039335 [Datura stramonium]|uniref:CASP-like protein n=1 Tax=Datura stramonium TaxID=4076 RepID=A0ABS8VNJ1_DATST|nr:hypothetical protein [Datura stramonium]
MTLANRIIIFLLRLLALGASVAAIIIMVTSHDSAQVLGMTFEAKFANTPTFKCILGVNILASGYSLIVLFFPTKNLLGRILLITDIIMTLLLDSSISACLAISGSGEKGNSHGGWLPLVGKFQSSVTVLLDLLLLDLQLLYSISFFFFSFYICSEFTH